MQRDSYVTEFKRGVQFLLDTLPWSPSRSPRSAVGILWVSGKRAWFRL